MNFTAMISCVVILVVAAVVAHELEYNEACPKVVQEALGAVFKSCHPNGVPKTAPTSQELTTMFDCISREAPKQTALTSYLTDCNPRQGSEATVACLSQNLNATSCLPTNVHHNPPQ